MVKKGYNWKSRQVTETIIDDSATKKIHLDLDVKGHYDRSNELVLPSSKRKTKVKTDKNAKVTKILTKKHRKKLEKIVEKKRKKENRASVLEALAQVQATPDELKKLTSITSIQTKGLKRYFLDEINPERAKKPKRDLQILAGDVKLNSLSGAKRRKLVEEEAKKPLYDRSDPNIVGFDDSDDSSSGSEEETVEETPAQVQEPPKEAAKTAKEPVKSSKPTVKTEENKTESRPALYVDVIRDEAIQESRLKLPILAEEQQIMEIINENPIVLIAGETGSGKTTQIPQFLYEAGYAMQKQIAITEPRRVAAVSMAHRVGVEMALPSEVGYLIRFEGNVTEKTRVKFMTDGVLLKEIQNDFLLRNYSVVIVDEAHERSVYTDILIALLSRIVLVRNKRQNPLKLIVMSATLRLEDFTENPRLFKTPPPVVKIDSRQFPVTIHFNKHTRDNYLEECYRKAVKIHTKLPEGGILIFVTGQQEVNTLVARLRRKFPTGTSGKRAKITKKKQIELPTIDLDGYDAETDENPALIAESSDSETDANAPYTPLWVLPLYSLLSTENQQAVFRTPPEHHRLCVVSTNVAETSLTIPHIKYVIDSGKTKEKLYDKVTGVTKYDVTWTSKASANQRAGRAGRTAPGHCYRLYSSAIYNYDMAEHTTPEIRLKPIDDLYLQMKCMGIEKIVNFPFPTAPDLMQLKSAERRLQVLGVVDERGAVTELGKAVAKFPLLPRYGKMLALSHQQGLLPYTVCLVAALSVPEVMLGGDGHEQNKWKTIRQKWAGTGNSLLLADNMVLLRAIGGAEYANSKGKMEQFCYGNGLRHKGVLEVRKLRLQLTEEIRANLPEVDLNVDPCLAPPSDLQAKLLRQILLAGLGDQVARRIDGEKYAYQAMNMEDRVFLHSASVLRGNPPEFLVYREIYELKEKMYMRGVTAIEPEWLPLYVQKSCNLSTPLKHPQPDYKNGRVYCTVTGTFGEQGWELPRVQIVHPQTQDCYKWFAKYLLEGAVFAKLARYASMLVSKPDVVVKSWAKLQDRCEVLLKQLVRRDVRSREQLEAIWSKEPMFLWEQYARWLPESARHEVLSIWPPLDS